MNRSDRAGIRLAAPGRKQSDVCRPILITCAQSESPIESAYPRPRDRRLSRKTRAAVVKSPGSTTAAPAVGSADGTGVVAVFIGNLEADATATATAVAIHKILAQHRLSSISRWLSQPG